MTVCVVIPTYGRDEVLCETIERVFAAVGGAPVSILVVDQSAEHTARARNSLERWESARRIRWVRLPGPSTAHAMNVGLLEAGTDLVVFIDDDVAPGEDWLGAHVARHAACPRAWAVAGQVLQPGQEPEGAIPPARGGGLRADLGFPFNSTRACRVCNVMAGNLSVKRDRAITVGGFDENFGPPVAYRFETEFARRITVAGGEIWFDPDASLRHLRAPGGGTRSRGSHLMSASPVHGVGDYYYALRCGKGLDRFTYLLWRPFREVRTRFHLLHPWWIPVKFVGELRALALALRLNRRGPRFITNAIPSRHT